MKSFYLLLFFLLFPFHSILAQSGTGFIGDGYYRVSNFGTGRYLYVTDNEDTSDPSKDSEDFQAIQLWQDINRAITDPATVIYTQQQPQISTNTFDLVAQSTGVHALTGFYVTVAKQSNGTYTVSAKVSKGGISVTKYLSDNTSVNKPQGKMGTNATGKYRMWIVDKMTVDHASNYFGLKPTIQCEGKYYQTFFAGFPFRTYSPDMHVYVAEKVAGGQVYMKELTGDIPACTPVLVECSSADPSQNRLELLPPFQATQPVNKLTGVYFCNGERPEESKDAFRIFDKATMRILTLQDGKLAFSDTADDRLSYIEVPIDWDSYDFDDRYCIPANTAYLTADARTPACLTLNFTGDAIKGITASKRVSREGVYSVTGRLMRSTNDTEGLSTGLYIVEGRKVFVK